MNPRHLPALLGAALVAAGCASPAGLTTHSTPTDPARLEAQRSLAAARLAPASWPGADWWKGLGDPDARAVGEALADSPSIRLAQARVERARSLAVAAGAPR
ncbi:MAG TPA: RND transporter, partial [Burkholderiales bacterium]|nr:RND transporter [Burkholderiales bacterium]